MIFKVAVKKTSHYVHAKHVTHSRTSNVLVLCLLDMVFTLDQQDRASSYLFLLHVPHLQLENTWCKISK